MSAFLFVALFTDSSYGDHLPKYSIACPTPVKTGQEESCLGYLFWLEVRAEHSPMQVACGEWKEWDETVMDVGVFQQMTQDQVGARYASGCS